MSTMFEMPMVGSSVQMDGLQGRPELNGQLAVVISQDHARGRAGVRVEGEPQPLSLKLCNLRSIAYPGGNGAGSTCQHSDLCLARHVVFDKLNFYYAFGNSPPAYVLPGVCGSADVLLLASGDLRSALYSLTRDAGRRLPVCFFVNDVDRHVLARNVLLLWLAHHAPAAHVFAVWFSLGLSEAAHASLHGALEALTGPSSADHLTRIGIDVWRPEDRCLIVALLRDWREMRLEWDRIQAQRRQVLRRFIKMDEDQLASSLTTGLLNLHSMSEPRSSALFDQLRAEVAAYCATGSVVPLGEEHAPPPTLPNPTLFRSPSEYDLHYGANPFGAFPLFAAEYAGPRPFAALCLRELEAWLAELKARTGCVRWTVGAGDCLHLCAAIAPRQFDVVATSNVADYVGLLPLLQAARLVTKHRGMLLTTTMLHLSYSDNLAGYLQANLFLEPALWPGVLGWRCVGHEGVLAPQSSLIRLGMPSVDGILLKSFQIEVGKVRGEEDLIWTRAEPTNLPIDASKGELATLARACRLQAKHLPFGFSFVPMVEANKDGVNRLHLHSLLPVLAAAAETDGLLEPADREMRDVLAYWRGELHSLVVASMPLSEAAVHTTIEKQPHLAVLLETRQHGTLVYSALWLSRDSGDRRVCWLVDPVLLAGAVARLVGGAPIGRALAQATHLQGEPCPDPSPALVARLRSPSVAGWPGLSRSEAADATRVVVRLTDEWWRRLEAGEQPELVPLGDGGCALALRFKSRRGEAEEKVELRFPTRVDAARCKLQLSRTQRELTLVVPRAPYGFETRAAPELWLDDWHAWQLASHLKEQFFLTVSGMQMSPQERFIARSRSGAAVPPLIALKDTVMVFFQCLSVERMQLLTPGSGVVALILHHGIRRDHRSGGVAADVSVCMLNMQILNTVVPWWMHDGAAPCSIKCEPDEVDLFQRFVHLLAGRAKDASSWSVPPRRARTPAHLKRHFVRLLFPPLCAPDEVINKGFGHVAQQAEGAELSWLEELKSHKEDGARLVRQGRHGEAIESFQTAVFRYLNLKNCDDAKEKAAEGAPLVAQCYLNIALCLLEPSTPAKASEVEVCCRAALDLLGKPGGGGTPALLAKAHYRMGLARELSGDRKGAAKAFSAALRCTPGEPTIQAAMERHQL